MFKSYYEDCFEEHHKKVIALFNLVPLVIAPTVIELEAIKYVEKSFHVLKALSDATTDLTPFY